MFSALNSRAKFWLSIAGLTFVAGFFRFFRLHTLPLGLYHDEAMNGTDAIVARLSGHYHVFYPANEGREGLLINLQALSISLFGATPWALRAVTALFGVLTCLGLFLLVRDLYDDRHAIVAGILQAILVWPVVTSRIGLRAQLSVTCLVWLLFMLVRSVDLVSSQNRKHWAIFSGIFLGLGFYTYIAFRIVPLLVLAIAFIASARGAGRLRQRYFLVAISASLVSLPLITYFFENPSALVARAAHVSLLARPDGKMSSFVRTLAEELQMPFVRGDANPRHNACSEPVIPLILLPFFLAGVWHILRVLISKSSSFVSMKWRESLLLAWIVVCSIPNLLSEPSEQPHGLRLILLQPVFPILIAVGFAAVQLWLKNRFRSKVVLAIAPLMLLGAVVYEYDTIFRRWEESRFMKHAFAYSTLPLVQSLESTQSLRPRYIVGPWYDSAAYGIPITAQSVAFLTQTIAIFDQDRKNIHYTTQHAIDVNAISVDSIDLIPVPDPGD
jgi:4-amino-4-deoxy-L-arabinose transferase-like glycosyltransferase